MTSPHISYSLWPAPAQARDRAGGRRGAYRQYGQAVRRTVSRAWAGPQGWVSAAGYGHGPLNRMTRYAFRDPHPYPTRRNPTQAAGSMRNAG
jgi:hypothetical protein